MSAENDRYLPIDRFNYHLPPELIAQQPIEPRDASRMLVVNRGEQSLLDRTFLDLPQVLDPGDLLVMNDTRVLPARLFARRATGGRVEILLLRERQGGTWNALARSSRRLQAGENLVVLDADGDDTDDVVRFLEHLEDGTVDLHADNMACVLNRFGRMPLPPYVEQNLDDPERYQTVYAVNPGSAAAPTAGLHFTERVLAACADRGIQTERVTLHVGLDTFQPVKADNALEHEMHSEWFRVPARTLEAIRAAKIRGSRVVAVGTTVARTLESVAGDLSSTETLAGSTRIYITPPYSFKIVDAMLTNFHLPRTTLLLMISALAGEDLVRHAYEHAVRQRYRFYSFGDAMLIV